MHKVFWQVKIKCEEFALANYATLLIKLKAIADHVIY